MFRVSRETRITTSLVWPYNQFLCIVEFQEIKSRGYIILNIFKFDESVLSHLFFQK